MKLSEIVTFFLSSNIFVSLCVVALCQSSAIILDVNATNLLPFVFFSSLFSYNFLRFVRFNYSENKDQNLRLTNGQYKWITLFSAILCIYFSSTLSLSTIMILLPAILLTLLYAVRLPIFKTSMALREIPTVKLFLIAFVWSMVTVGIVANEHQLLYSLEVLILFLSRFFFVAAITIPFDIRDMGVDPLSMKTIPQRVGVSRAILISVMFLAVFEVLSIVHFVLFDFHFSLLFALLLCSLCTAYLIYKIDIAKTRFYYSFWIEGASLLMLVLLFFIPLAFGIFVL